MDSELLTVPPPSKLLFELQFIAGNFPALVSRLLAPGLYKNELMLASRADCLEVLVLFPFEAVVLSWTAMVRISPMPAARLSAYIGRERLSCQSDWARAPPAWEIFSPSPSRKAP